MAGTDIDSINVWINAMKKSQMLAMALLATCGTAVAAGAPAFVMETGMAFNNIPGSFTADGQTKLVGEGENNSYTVFDADFRQVKTVTMPTKQFSEGEIRIYDDGREEGTLRTSDISMMIPLNWECTPEGLDTDTRMELTQTLFNEDAKYEYLYADYEQVVKEHRHENPGGTPFTTKRYSAAATKCYVKDEDGNQLASFDLNGKQLAGGSYSAALLTLGGKTYVKFETVRYIEQEDGTYSENQWFIYSVDRPTGSVKQVAVINGGIKVNPTLTNGDTPVEVSLDSPAATDMAVTVVGMNGAVSHTSKINAGQSGVTLNLNNLSKGIYVVNVAGREHTKLIIR